MSSIITLVKIKDKQYDSYDIECGPLSIPFNYELAIDLPLIKDDYRISYSEDIDYNIEGIIREKKTRFIQIIYTK